ncbi:MAG TPA: hypothetical protein VJY41_09945, partial [Prolixibacteraceae bacterium]|nr:hypothetical protein [Prolixibacteraceae bacterium]
SNCDYLRKVSYSLKIGIINYEKNKGNHSVRLFFNTYFVQKKCFKTHKTSILCKKMVNQASFFSYQLYLRFIPMDIGTGQFIQF